MPNQFLGVLLHTLAISGLSRVRTEFFHLLVIPSLAPHPVHLTSRTRSLEQKVLNAIRMKFKRRGFPETTLTPEWNDFHPLVCACVPSFCSNPSTI
jgi:hypothetical protein